jgi:hypothetical protein
LFLFATEGQNLRRIEVVPSQESGCCRQGGPFFEPPVNVQPDPGLLPVMKVPVCVIGSRMNLSSPNGSQVKNVTLAVLLNSDCQVPLRFASRLAQEAHSNLKVLHILDRKRADLNTSALNPDEVASQLPLETWREAGLLCPAEITVRRGDPAEEILEHLYSGNEGPIVLCSSGIGSGEQAWRDSVSYRVLAEARYPVFVRGRRVPSATVIMSPEKPSALSNKQRLSVHRTVNG